MTAAEIALAFYMLVFVLLVSVAALADLTVHWGRFGATTTPMSRRSKILFAVTAWCSVGMVLGGILQLPFAGSCRAGFVLGVVGTLVSAAIDHRYPRRSTSRRLSDYASTNPSLEHRNRDEGA